MNFSTDINIILEDSKLNGQEAEEGKISPTPFLILGKFNIHDHCSCELRIAYAFVESPDSKVPWITFNSQKDIYLGCNNIYYIYNISTDLINDYEPIVIGWQPLSGVDASILKTLQLKEF